MLFAAQPLLFLWDQKLGSGVDTSCMSQEQLLSLLQLAHEGDLVLGVIYSSSEKNIRSQMLQMQRPRDRYPYLFDIRKPEFRTIRIIA